MTTLRAFACGIGICFITSGALANPITSAVEAIGTWADGPSGYTHVAPGGDNRALAVMCHVEANDPPTDCSSVTYGGQPLTLAIEALQNQGNAFGATAEIWILDEAGISAGAGSGIVATFTEPGTSPDDTRWLSSQFFSGVDQDDPIGEIGTDGENANDTQTLSVVLSGGELDAGDMIIANQTMRSDGTGQVDWNWQNGFIEIGEYSPGLNCDFAPHLCFSDAIKQALGTDETVTVTVLNNGVAALAVASLNHVAAIPEPSSLMLSLLGFAALIGCQRRRGRR